jgi:hypothetical protein
MNEQANAEAELEMLYKEIDVEDDFQTVDQVIAEIIAMRQVLALETIAKKLGWLELIADRQ